jgi:hypothetical protein
MEQANNSARLAAMEAGEKTFKGPACKEGHDGLRHVINGQCVECNRIRSRDRARKLAADPDVVAERERRLNERAA